MNSNFDPATYWNRVVSGKLDLSTVGYPELGTAWNVWSYKMRGISFLKALRTIGIDPGFISVLEVGFGVGYYLSIWSQLHPNGLTGVDISSAAVKQATARYPNFRFIEGDISNVEIAESSYDLVTAVDVLYHIVDDDAFKQVILKLVASVKAGGCVLFTDRLQEGQISDMRFSHVRCRPLSSYRRATEHLNVSVETLNLMMVFMANPTQTTKRGFAEWFLRQTWRIISIPLRNLRKQPALQNAVGTVLGAFFFLLDRIVTRFWGGAPNLKFGVIRVPTYRD